MRLAGPSSHRYSSIEEYNHCTDVRLSLEWHGLNAWLLVLATGCSGCFYTSGAQYGNKDMHYYFSVSLYSCYNCMCSYNMHSWKLIIQNYFSVKITQNYGNTAQYLHSALVTTKHFGTRNWLITDLFWQNDKWQWSFIWWLNYLYFCIYKHNCLRTSTYCGKSWEGV